MDYSGGGGLFPTGGNREATNPRGRTGDGDHRIGGGGRHGEATEVIGEAAFAERKGGAAFGGNGLGRNSNPPIFLQQGSPDLCDVKFIPLMPLIYYLAPVEINMSKLVLSM